MKIALFCSSRNIIPPLKSGGTEQPIYYLAKELAARGHDVCVYAARGSKIPGVRVKEISPFATCVRQKFLNIQDRIASFYDLSALGDFFQQDADNFDIIQFNSYVFYEILPFTRFSNTPVIIRINYPHNLLYPYIKAELKKYKNVSFLPISRFVTGIMPSISYENPIPPAVDMVDFPFSAKADDYLLFIGRIRYNKGVHLAIKAAKSAKQKLIIAGRLDGEAHEQYYNKEIKPNLDKNIRYIGEVDFKQKIKLYQGASATLFPINLDEPFGNVMIESMACGTPVIALDKAATGEAINDKQSGFLVKDIAEMASAVKNIPLLDRKKVRAWANEKFSIKKVVLQYEELYKRIIEAKK